MAKEQIQLEELPEAAQVGAGLIAAHHPELEEARILYISTTQMMRSRGRAVLGKTVKLGPRERWLSLWRDRHLAEACDFMLLFQVKLWARLTPVQRRAAVDHELMHCGVEEVETDDGGTELRYSLVGHDLEEFREIVARHGLWQPDVRAFAEVAVQQLALPGLAHPSVPRAPLATAIIQLDVPAPFEEAFGEALQAGGVEVVQNVEAGDGG